MAKKSKKQIDIMKKMSFKPILYFTSDDLEELKDWKVGNTYTMTIKAKLIDLSLPAQEPYGLMEEEGMSKDEMKGKFEVTDIETTNE